MVLLRLVLATVCLIGAAAPAGAQALDSRVELGIHGSWLGLADVGTHPRGLGSRVSVDLLRWLVLEGEVTAYPKDDVSIDSAPGVAPAYRLTYRRSRFEGLFGARAGVRRGRFGVFAKLRPGFTRLDDGGITCEGPVCPLILLAPPAYRTELALDAGGVLEFFAAPTAVIRLDVGDTIIRHRSAAPPCAACTTHNVTTRLGIGVRF